MHLRQVRFQPERYPTRDHYPFNQPLFHEQEAVDFPGAVTFFVGENGAGKSTLLEALSRRCGIHIWRNEDGLRYTRNPYEKLLANCLDVTWADGPVPGSFFGSESFRFFVEALDEWATADPALLRHFGGESLLTKSHGESLMSFFRSRYKLRGLYLLDEPETALSPRTQLDFLKILDAAGQDGRAQFIIATHSPILMGCPGATIYDFDRVPLRRLAWRDTEHFQVYRDFLNNPESYLDNGP